VKPCLQKEKRRKVRFSIFLKMDPQNLLHPGLSISGSITTMSQLLCHKPGLLGHLAYGEKHVPWSQLHGSGFKIPVLPCTS
jgi:hypothetical protein